MARIVKRSSLFLVPYLLPFAFCLLPSESLSDAEVEAEVPCFGFAVHEQAGNGIELKAKIGANRTNRRLVAQSGTDVVAEALQIEAETIAPDVAAVHEYDGAKVAPDVGAQLGGKIQE